MKRRSMGVRSHLRNAIMLAVFMVFGMNRDSVWAGFSPVDIHDLRMWLDASQITGLDDGDRVHRWEDSSTNNVDMGTLFTRYNNSAERSPILASSGLAGKPVLRFSQDGSVDDYMNTGATFAPGSSNLSLSQPATLVVVFAPRSAASDSANWAFSSGQVQYHSAKIGSQASPWPTWISSVTETLDTYSVDTLTFQGFEVTSQYYRNGTLFRSGAVGTTASGQSGILGELGLAAKAGPGGGYKPIDYAEIIAIGRAINASERNALDFYLEMKYDLPTSAGGVMLTGTVPGSTITSSGTIGEAQAPLTLTPSVRGSVAIGAALVASQDPFEVFLRVSDTDSSPDVAALLTYLQDQSNSGQFHVAASGGPGFDIKVTFPTPSASQQYFNWDLTPVAATLRLDVVQLGPPPQGTVVFIK